MRPRRNSVWQKGDERETNDPFSIFFLSPYFVLPAPPLPHSIITVLLYPLTLWTLCNINSFPLLHHLILVSFFLLTPFLRSHYFVCLLLNQTEGTDETVQFSSSSCSWLFPAPTKNFFVQIKFRLSVALTSSPAIPMASKLGWVHAVNHSIRGRINSELRCVFLIYFSCYGEERMLPPSIIRLVQWNELELELSAQETNCPRCSFSLVSRRNGADTSDGESLFAKIKEPVIQEPDMS